MKRIYQFLVIFLIIDVLVVFVSFQVFHTLLDNIIIIGGYNFLLMFFYKKTRLVIINGPDIIPYFYIFTAFLLMSHQIIISVFSKQQLKACIWELHSKNLTAQKFRDCGISFDNEINFNIFLTIGATIFLLCGTYLINKNTKSKSKPKI